jgi:hypothetical protein
VNGSSSATGTRMALKCLLGSGTGIEATYGEDRGRVDTECGTTPEQRRVGFS